MDIKISIVVPVYNAEKYLNECIMSVLNQTSDSWELILVDDGSTDKSGEICDSFAKNNIEKIKVFHNENYGQFYSRTFGIKQCKGDYIGFLDSDDVLSDNYVESLKRSVEKYNNPDVICFDFCRWDGENVIKIFNHQIDNDINFFADKEHRKIVYSMIIERKLEGSLCSKLFRAELIRNISVDDSEVRYKRYGEDSYQAYSILAKAETIVIENLMLYYYRMNPDSVSYGYETRDLDYFNTRYVYDVIYKNLASWGMNTQENKQKIFGANFDTTVYFMLLYYRSAQSKERKKAVVDFDWGRYLLTGADINLDSNPYIRKSYIKVWSAFKEKRYLEISFREKFKKYIGW